MTHRNAPLTPQGRYRLVMRLQAGRPIAHVAAEAGIARATLSKWVARYRQGGIPELEDRSSAPFHCPARTSAETVDLIEHWRRTHKWSARRISHELAVRGTVVSVKPRVLWRLVYLVPVVAGCDCSWRWWSWWVSGAQAASCSAGVRIPMAECGRVVLNQWTHSAVASTGGVDVLPRALVADQLGLVQRVERLGQSKAERNPP